MSHITIGNETLGSLTLPSNAHGHSGSMSVNCTNQNVPRTSLHRRFALAVVALLAVAFGSNPATRAQDIAPPISGALGQIQSVGENSISIQTKSGNVHIEITQPLTTYKVVPSDLNHIADNEYIGVASTQLPNGTHVAKQIFIFPMELRGAVEGSVVMDAQPGTATQSRMTNGSVSLRGAVQAPSRMTNGVVQKGSRTTLIAVRFAYEFHDDSGQWFRAYGNENWEFNVEGIMHHRYACINDLQINEADRLFHWPQGRRPDDHPGLSDLGL